MIFEELNLVRKVKKQIAEENKKLKALEIVIESFPHKYGKSESGGQTSKIPTSPFEIFLMQKCDCEEKIEMLQMQLREEVPRLTKKIQENFTDSTEQTLLLYRYVACKFFKEISFLLGYSERRVYKIHEQIIKKVQSNSVACSR